MKWIKLCHLIWILVTFPMIIRAAMEAFVVGGQSASIKDYPYSAFVGVQCDLGEDKLANWICGSSIINQHFVLTAAHCVDGCIDLKKVNIVVGNSNRHKGVKTSGKNIQVHEKHDAAAGDNDIALIMVKTPFKFNNLVKRVALLQTPTSYQDKAVVAGWGKIDEIKNIGTRHMMATEQSLLSRIDCMKTLNWSGIPHGCFCGGSLGADSYAAAGDSGSALVVKGYVQIGLVSHKLPEISRSIVVYTETYQYYNWIEKSSAKMFCGNGNMKE